MFTVLKIIASLFWELKKLWNRLQNVLVDKKNFLTLKIAFFVLGQGTFSKRPILLELGGGGMYNPHYYPKNAKIQKIRSFLVTLRRLYWYLKIK
jgi:hypothetical protein